MLLSGVARQLNKLYSLNLRMSCANFFLFFLSFFLYYLIWADCLSSVCPSVNVCNVFQKNWDNFNQTRHIAILSKGNTGSFKRRAISVSKVKKLQNREKNIDEILKILPQNGWANFNQTWQKATLSGRNSSSFQIKGHAFSKGKIMK